MFDRYTSAGTRADRRRGGSWAMEASLLAHLLLLIGAVRSYHPTQPPSAPEPASPQPVYFDLPPFPSAAPAGNSQAALTGGSSSPPAPRLPSRIVAGEPVAPALPPQPGNPAPEAAPTVQQAAPRPTLRAAPLDPRLYVDTRAVPAPPPSPERRIEAHARAAADSLAARRGTVTIAGRRVEMFRDSGEYRRARLELGGKYITMPGDGRDWADLELRRQDADAARDSVLRERARITRERNDAKRRPLSF